MMAAGASCPSLSLNFAALPLLLVPLLLLLLLAYGVRRNAGC